MTTFTEFSDEQLLALLKADDEDGFTEIYNRYWKHLLNTAYNIIRDGEAAQDIVQNIFISLWQRRQHADIYNLKSYLHQATRFAVLNVIREQQMDIKFYDRLKIASTEIIADDPLLFKEQQGLLKELLASMPESYSEAFRLSREQGLTYRQIAAQLHISEKTVEKRMSRSLKYLKRGLNWELCVAIILGANN